MKNFKVKSLSIIFPLYNEESRLKNSLKKINFLISKIKHINYEILLINDGSRDNSDSLITNYLKSLNSKQKKKFTYIKYKNNKGKGFACKVGVKAAKKNWIMTCDIDFSTSPLEIINWNKKNYISSNEECYFGSRNLTSSKIDYKIYRRFLGKIFSNFRKYLFDIDILDTQCGFKLYPKKIAKIIFMKLSQNGYIHDVELCIILKKMSIKINELPIRWKHVGNSKLNILIDGSMMMYDLIMLKFNNK